MHNLMNNTFITGKTKSKGPKKKKEHNNNKSEYIELNQKKKLINTTIEQTELKKL